MRISGLIALRRCTAALPELLDVLPATLYTALRGVKTQANEVRSGNVVDVDGSLLEVIKTTHTVGRGRQLGNVQIELRDLKTGRKQQLRQRPYDRLEAVQLRSKTYQYLYSEGNQLCLMDPEEFTQVTVDEGIFGEQRRWLADGMEVTLSCLQDGSPIMGELPAAVTLKVADGGVYTKGDSASAHMKECTLENGQSVMVPPYVQTGQNVVINSRTGEFLRRLS